MDFIHFDIIWTEFRVYSKEIIIQKHKHDFFHFIYVDSGTGCITIGDKTFDMLPGKLYAVPMNTEHGFFSKGKTPLETFEIKFYAGEKEAETIHNLFPYCINVENTPVSSILLALYQESHDTKPLSSDIIRMQFRLFLTYLLRSCEQVQTDSGHSTENLSPEIEKVTRYITENLSEDISLETLADIAGFEKNYFLRKFKKQLKCTPIVFIRNKRIEKAKELLRYSDMNITQIALSMGFKSVHYFSKVFYEDTHIRPSEYKSASYKPNKPR